MDGPTLLPEFDAEMANTRRVLERVPTDRMDFKPHEKSFTLKELATHLANLPVWTPMTLSTEELDLEQDWDRPDPADASEILALFDRTSAEARTALEGASREDMKVAWTLRGGDQVYFTMPRGSVIRTFVMNHMVHHRGQLTVYLRLLDVPVPGAYGPSADEM